jgi:DNA-binding NtrC family response regulator
MSDKPLAARILLIDDDPSIQRAFRRALQDRGHGVVVASSTNEAVAALNRSPFDLCLLDLCLGGESGIELLPRIRELAPWLRVVVVTASSDVQTAISAIRAGAADFLSKPCSPDELMHTVGQQIEAIRIGKRPDFDKAEEAQIYDFVREMLDNKRVCDATYAATRTLVGEQGLVDLVTLMGYYTMISFTLNCFAVPVPEGQTAPFNEPTSN